MSDKKDNKPMFLGVQFELDKASIVKSFDAFDKLSPADWKKAGETYGVPVEPFSKQLLRPVLFGAVQDHWYKTHASGVPALAKANQERRVSRYKEQLEELKKNDGKDFVTAHKKTSADSKPRVANLYRMTDSAAKMLDEGKVAGQKYVILQTMHDMGAVPGKKGVTVRAVFEGQKKFPGILPPSDKNCAFHFNKFSHEGLVEQVNEQGLVIGDEKPAAVAKPKAAAAEAPKKKAS